jgi:excisionase family DNA binding protein
MPWSASELTTAQAARRLGVTPRTVRNWVRDGRLKAHRVSERVVRIPADEVERLMNRGSAARPDLSSIAWDFNPAALDEDASARFVIGRVLEAGSPSQLAWLMRRYPLAMVLDVAKTDRGLSRPVASAWSVLLKERDDRTA